MNNVAHWLTDSAVIRFSDLVFAGYRGVCAAQLDRQLPFELNEWLCFDGKHLESGWRSFIYPGLRGLPELSIRRGQLPAFFKDVAAIGFADQKIADSDFLTAEATVELGWSMLVVATAKHRVVDSMENAIALAIIGLGEVGLRRYSYCELCFRIAPPGFFRCSVHTRSKNAEVDKSRPAYETDARIARRLLPMVRESDLEVNVVPNIFGMRWMLGYSVPYLPIFKKGSRKKRSKDVYESISDKDEVPVCCNRVPIGLPQEVASLGGDEANITFEWQHEEHLIQDLADTWVAIALSDIALRKKVLRTLETHGQPRHYCETSPRVLERVGEEILTASVEEQVRQLRAVIDPDNPSLNGLMLSIRMAEAWYELVEKQVMRPQKQARSRYLAGEIRNRVNVGETKAEIAKKLGLSGSNLSNLLRRYPP